ncbi:hypothetical protein KIL84_015767, partial [Mauremys mutica]
SVSQRGWAARGAVSGSVSHTGVFVFFLPAGGPADNGLRRPGRAVSGPAEAVGPRQAGSAGRRRAELGCRAGPPRCERFQSWERR